MNVVVNTHQADAWNGYEGQHWADHSERYDTVNDGANEPLFASAAIQPTDRVLDIGCGTGKTTRIAAGYARDGNAVGIDLSAPMLSRARELATDDGHDNIEFVQGDAQTYDFPRDSFDVAISRFGVMFFSDSVAAFTNIASALRPGGRLSFVALGKLRAESELMVPFVAIDTQLPPPDSVDTSGEVQPDSLADPDRTRTVLGQAGFSEIEIEGLRVPMRLGADARDAAEFLIGWGPVQYAIAQAGVVEFGPLVDLMHDALRPFERPGGLILHSDVWRVSARR